MAVRRGKNSFDDGSNRDLVDLAERGQLRAVPDDATNFLASLRYRDSRGGLGPTGTAQLDELIPGWRTLTPREIDYGWYMRHNLPLPSWDDDYIAILLEGRLEETGEAGESWLTSMRSAININAARGTLDYLDTTFPGWRFKTIARLDRDARKRDDNRALHAERELAKSERRRNLHEDSARFLDAAEKGRLSEQIEANDWLKAMRELEAEGALDDAEVATLTKAAPSWRFRTASQLDREKHPRRATPKTNNRRVTVAHYVTTRLARLAKVWPDGPFDSADRTWLNLQRSLRNNGKLNPETDARITTALPGWEDPATIAHVRESPVRQRPIARVDATRKRFLTLAEQGNLTLQARGAQRWLIAERAREAAGELEPAIIEQLDKTIPDWRTAGPQGLDRATRKTNSPLDPMMVDAARWGRMHLRTDANQWLRSKRDEDERGVINEDVKAALDEYVPEWRKRTAAILDRLRAKELLGQSLPKADEAFLTLVEGNHIDEAGPAVQEWLDDVRARFDRGAAADAVVFRLDSVLPKWRDS